MVTLDTPESLSTRVLNALKADPRTVELRGLAPNFYGLAIRFLECYEEEEIVDVLSAVSFRELIRRMRRCSGGFD